jgi:hypothetical protein
MPSDERAELELQLMKYKQLARLIPDDLVQRGIKGLIEELEQKLREMDAEEGRLSGLF